MPDSRSDTTGAVAQNRPGLWAWAVLLFAGTAWGVTFSLAKIVTEAGAHPVGVTYWQAVIGAAVLFVFLMFKRIRLPVDRPHLVFFLVCGLLGTVISGIVMFVTAPKLPAGVLAITLSTVPLLTFAIAYFIRIESFEALRVGGVLIGLVAIVLMIAPDTSLPDPSAAPWVLIAVLVSLCYAVENIYIGVRLPPGTHASAALAGMLSVAAIIMTPLMFVPGMFVPLSVSHDVISGSIVLMALINVMSYGLFVYLVSVAGPVFASQMGYVVTVSGIAWGMVIFSENHSLWIWASVALLFVGLTLVRPRETTSGAASG